MCWDYNKVAHHAGKYQSDKVGVVGFGGLVYMAVQYLASLGADVTAFDITEEKHSETRSTHLSFYECRFAVCGLG